jgi:hypothetical protein
VSGVKKNASNQDTSFDPVRSTSAALAGTAGIVIKASAGRLYRLDVVNNGATPYFLQVFDKAIAPVNGDTPIWRRRLPASGELSLSLEEFGLFCAAGISIAISSTANTLTLAVASDLAWAAQYK